MSHWFDRLASWSAGGQDDGEELRLTRRQAVRTAATGAGAAGLLGLGSPLIGKALADNAGNCACQRAQRADNRRVMYNAPEFSRQHGDLHPGPGRVGDLPRGTDRDQHRKHERLDSVRQLRKPGAAEAAAAEIPALHPAWWGSPAWGPVPRPAGSGGGNGGMRRGHVVLPDPGRRRPLLLRVGPLLQRLLLRSRGRLRLLR